MNRILFAGAALFLCAASFAQTNYASSPKGYLSTEGDRFSYMFGSYADARLMFFDGEFRNQLMILKEISYRLDNRSYTSSTGQGRTWTKVTLQVGECDFDKIDIVSTVFSTNWLRTPTKVFSGSVTWATQIGNPTQQPAKWDIKFPFTTSYVHIGTKDLCTDYDFSGGTLANSAVWATNRRYSYYLDGINTSSYTANRQTYYGTTGTGRGCIDSASTNNRGAYNYFYCYYYGQSHPTRTFRDKYRIWSYSYYTGPNAPVVHAVSLGGSPAGVAFPGVACNRLHLNPATIFLRAGAVANATGFSGQVFPTGTANGLVPYIKSAVGASVYHQAAWDDTRNRALKFTRAVETKIPAPQKTVKHSMVVQWTPALKDWWGYGPYPYYYYNPLRRYTY